MCILVRLLHEFLLPWFGVRNGIRSNDANYLDWAWRYSIPMFRACNKNLYAAYGVHVTTIVNCMGPAVRAVWHHYRTASLTGRNGRNVAWDYVLEKMNLNFKTYLSSHVTEDRLEKFGVMLNALKHIRKTFDRAWRRVDHDFHDDDGGEYTHFRPADVDALVCALKDHLGASIEEVEENHLLNGWGKNPFANNS